MASLCSRVCSALNRKKQLEEDIMTTPLSRCLNTFDLTLLGIGHMVGAGIFVLTGTVVVDLAGGATFISYFFAGVAALLSALCYAEFGARVPKAGSAYTYTYVTVGEFWAFIIGWNIILEHLLGAASVARALSGSIDTLFNGAIQNWTMSTIGTLDVEYFSEYLDFVAMFSVIVVMAFVACGAKISINFNSTFTIINLISIVLIITVGIWLADVDNWSSVKGGFMPYGVQGVVSGAATCFYAYIGFEGIATAGEEAKNPARSIPMATFISMVIVTVLYMLCSAALTLMVPYYDVNVVSPFPAAFEECGATWAMYVVAVGALFGISTSLTGGIFTLPRSIYAMASDGLLFRFLAYIHPRTQTPVIAVFIFGMLAALLALLIDLEVLVEFLSIGTLLSFTMVAACVLILRYQPVAKSQFKMQPESPSSSEDYDSVKDGDKKGMIKPSQSHQDIGKLRKQFSRIELFRTADPETLTTWAIIIMAAFMFALAILLQAGWTYVSTATWWAILLLIFFSLAILTCFGTLLMFEQNSSFLTFQIPFVPFVPSLSMMLNILMMVELSWVSWVRLAVWLIIGFVIYFAYGVHHSRENRPLASYSQVLHYGGDGQTSMPALAEQPSEKVAAGAENSAANKNPATCADTTQ